MPTLGLGCWQSPPDQLSSAVSHALKEGYRHIDGATIYGNESSLGEGIRQSGVERGDIWVTTKLWNCTS
jgi:diketogulonate reductase-like aldo/keto reductase